MEVGASKYSQHRRGLHVERVIQGDIRTDLVRCMVQPCMRTGEERRRERDRETDRLSTPREEREEGSQIRFARRSSPSPVALALAAYDVAATG